MNSTSGQTNFHPYKIIQQGRSSLQLAPNSAPKVAIYAFRFIPLIMLAVGAALFILENEPLFLYIFGGIALLEAVIFSFIKVPAAVSMDSMGFTLETLSIKGRQEQYYLWSDVEYIRHRITTAKNNTTLTYTAMMNEGKKINFLNKSNYNAKKQSIAEINEVLRGISKKDVREK